MIDLDNLDYQLLQLLMKNGQITNVELSKKLNTSVNTVRNRIQRLVDNQVVRIVGITNPRLLGFDVHVIMGLDVEYSCLKEVAQAFKALNPVRYVAYSSGEHNLIVMAFFQNMEQYFSFITEKVTTMKGVLNMNVNFVGEEEKRNYDYVAHIEEIQKQAKEKKK